MRREEEAEAEAHRAETRTRAEVEAEAKRGYYDRQNSTRETLLQRVSSSLLCCVASLERC